jgi:hypothetical protein
MSQLRVNGISSTDASQKINVLAMPADGYYVRKIVTQIDTTSRTSGTSWTLGPTFANITDLQAGSLLRISYHVPMRNDSTSWGGGYIEPQVRFNQGTYQSLGSSGYDGGVMNLGNAAIGSYFQSILIDPAQASGFSAQFRFYFRSYDGTVQWNQSHDINNRSGTATLMPGDNGNQHFMNIITEELARFRP